jgi:hypothetical protein
VYGSQAWNEMSRGTDVEKNEGEVLTTSLSRWTFTWTGRLEDQRCSRAVNWLHILLQYWLTISLSIPLSECFVFLFLQKRENVYRENPAQ